jgi:hypothetical protein
MGRKIRRENSKKLGKRFFNRVYGILYGNNSLSSEMKIENQKITAYIPRDLLCEAQNVTKAGITETLKFGLEKVLQTKNYESLGKLCGKYNSNLDLSKIRDDR